VGEIKHEIRENMKNTNKQDLTFRKAFKLVAVCYYTCHSISLMEGKRKRTGGGKANNKNDRGAFWD